MPYDVWTDKDPAWAGLSDAEKAAAMSILEAGLGNVEESRNTASAMINRAIKEKVNLGSHVSQPIYQPTIEENQHARLPKVLGSEHYRQMVDWVNKRLRGEAEDTVKGATHFLAPPEQMLAFERREPGKYKNWGPRGMNWTGYDPGTGKYAGYVTEDKVHHFLTPDPTHKAPKHLPRSTIGEASPASSSFAQYLKGAANSVASLPGNISNWRNNLPASSGNYRSALVGGPNYIADVAVRAATRGKYGYPEAWESVGVPADRSRESIQEFQNAYAPYLQAVGNMMEFTGAVPIARPVNVSRGAQQIIQEGGLLDKAASQFENMASAAGNPAQSNVFVGFPPGAALNKAKSLRKLGSNPREIFKETGAALSPSGKYVKEIPDNKAWFRPLSNFKPGDEVPLSEFYTHGELYDAMPQLKNVKVKFVSVGAEAPPVKPDKGNGIIYVNTDNKDAQRFPDLLKREITKGIQYYIDDMSPENPVAFGHSFEPNMALAKDTVKRVQNIAETSSNPEVAQAAEGFVKQNSTLLREILDSKKYMDSPSKNKILKQSTIYMQKVSSGVPPDKIKLTEEEWREAVSKHLHNINAGNISAMTARDRSTKSGGDYPFMGKIGPNNMVYSFPRKKTTNEDLEKFLLDWNNEGPRYGIIRPMPYAEGGVVKGSKIMPQDYPPIPERNPSRPWASAETQPMTPEDMAYADQDYRSRIAARGYPMVVTESPGMHYGEYNPLAGQEYMAYAEEARKLPHANRIEASEPLRKLGGGDPYLGYLMSLAGTGDREAQYYLELYQSDPFNSSQALAMQMQQKGAKNNSRPPAYADGGEVTDSPDGRAYVDEGNQIQDPAGSGGTDDAIAAEIPEDSHIIPVEVLTKLGRGDPQIGAEILRAIIDSIIEEDQNAQAGAGVSGGQSAPPAAQAMKQGGRANGERRKVPVLISNKELILTPEEVQRLGGGNMDAGHAKLTGLRMRLRG